MFILQKNRMGAYRLFVISIAIICLFTACNFGKGKVNESSNTLKSSGTVETNKSELPITREEKLELLEGLVAGDIFRDYLWKGPFRNESKYQRVTGPTATDPGAKRFLPNPINNIVIEDLEHAVKAEMIIETWGGHAGTTGKSVRLNDNEWLPVPESPVIGTTDPENYYQFRYPRISLPLEQLNEGDNKLEFTTTGQLPEGEPDWWPQWGVYSVVFRIYYDEEKSHVAGELSHNSKDNVITDGHTFAVKIDTDAQEVERVDYVGYYYDYDYNGDGIYEGWQCTYNYGEIKNHIGFSNSAPFDVTWDSDWVPDQKDPMTVTAIITNAQGISYVTAPWSGIQLERDKKTVVMYNCSDIPEKYGVNAEKSNMVRLDIPDELDKAEEARMTVITWNGAGTAAFELNRHPIASTLGKDHDYAIDELLVPLEYIQKGTNYIITRAVPYNPNPHGVEIMWPGAALKVRYPK